MNNEMTTDTMSNEEVIEVLKGIVFNSFDRTTPKERQALHLAIKALEQPQDDLISRKQVLDELMAHQYSQDFCKEHNIDYSINSSMVRIIVNSTPTVVPERPHEEIPRGDLISRSALK